jgi:hypothetical protein
MIDIILSGIAARISSQGITRLCASVYDRAKKHKQFVEQEEIVKSLYIRSNEIRMVKTIWQTDTPVDLLGFYYRPHVSLKVSDTGTKRIKVEGGLDVPARSKLVITGIAGQGKSMLMRYLCSCAFAQGDELPIFVELKRIQGSTSLRGEINEYLTSLRLPTSDEYIDGLCETNSITLLLDAFDEVDPTKRQSVIHEIERLCFKFPGLKIFVTSRPNYEIHNSAYFTLMTLEDLQGDEYKEVIGRLGIDDGQSKALITKIEQSHGMVSRLLITPLFVTMMVIAYKAAQIIPDNLSRFYLNLLSILLQRHDKSKPGFVRERKSMPDDALFEKCFYALCYETKNSRSPALGEKELLTYCGNALKRGMSESAPRDFLYDIVNITCLIVKDSDEYRFIHKSVQEFFAAQYIETLPDDVAIKFYEKMPRTSNGHHWEAELRYLSEIDTLRYYKFYTIPLIRDSFAIMNYDEAVNFDTSRGNVLSEITNQNFIITVHILNSQNDVAGTAGRGYLERIIPSKPLRSFEVSSNPIGEDAPKWVHDYSIRYLLVPKVINYIIAKSRIDDKKFTIKRGPSDEQGFIEESITATLNDFLMEDEVREEILDLAMSIAVEWKSKAIESYKFVMEYEKNNQLMMILPI